MLEELMQVAHAMPPRLRRSQCRLLAVNSAEVLSRQPILPRFSFAFQK